MTIEAVLFDTGHPSHGMCLGPNLNLMEFHGQMCEIEIVPLKGPPDPPPAYRGFHMVFFDQQANQGATIGRCPGVEAFAGWLCRVSLGKVAIEEIPSGDVMAMLRGG